MALRNIFRQFVNTAPVQFIAARLGLLHKWNFHLSKLGDRAQTNHEVGVYGENVAISMLRSEGCSILRHDWKIDNAGEIDIVCRDGNVLCFVEVKTRTSHYAPPRKAVNKKKRELIRSGGRAWLRLLADRDVAYRYDIVEVYLTEGDCPEVSWLKAAFGEKERSYRHPTY
jgi:putative endonuclease